MVTRLARVGKELAALRAIAMFFGGQEVMQLTIYIYIYLCTVHTVHSIPLRSIVLHGSTWPAYIRHIDLYHSISISKPISISISIYLYIYIYISVLHVCRCLVTWMEITIGRPLWVIELEQQLYHQIETKRKFIYKWGEGFDSHPTSVFVGDKSRFSSRSNHPPSWHAIQLWIMAPMHTRWGTQW